MKCGDFIDNIEVIDIIENDSEKNMHESVANETSIESDNENIDDMIQKVTEFIKKFIKEVEKNMTTRTWGNQLAMLTNDVSYEGLMGRLTDNQNTIENEIDKLECLGIKPIESLGNIKINSKNTVKIIRERMIVLNVF